MALVRTTRAEQTVQAKQRILDAAARMFAERGYAATAMQDLAAELGLTRAALYYHYPAKGDILQAIIDAETARFAATLNEIAAIPTRPARIDAVIDALIASGLSQRRPIDFLVANLGLRTLPGDGPDFFDRVAVAIYSRTPTPEQLWAVNVAFMSFAALPSFAHLTDEELAPILSDSLRRIFRVR
ncbi:TetR/AcrR family transcriptional regulator [uncultured Microbacterium sp.]|uniref:TetR/AcrR family transcriptional regulator n=1 Tax=uncultured Microbacterium sp. TaxID=191216 RepID=UPI0035CC813A